MQKMLHLKALSGTEGVVINKKLFQRAKKDKNAKVREKTVLDKIEKVHEKCCGLTRSIIKQIAGVVKRSHFGGG